MDELEEFCTRVLGSRAAGESAAARARGEGGRLQALSRAAAACRAAGGSAREAEVQTGEGAGHQSELAGAVAGELARANRRLPVGQREALALRQLGCSHEELARVLGIDPAAAAPLLARARLRLRAELRGGPSAPTLVCPERERALRTISLRQDGEPVPEADEDWLLDHLGHCAGCGQAHAASLEAAVCYGAWRVAPAP